jgi:hypothetical protein
MLRVERLGHLQSIPDWYIEKSTWSASGVPAGPVYRVMLRVDRLRGARTPLLDRVGFLGHCRRCGESAAVPWGAMARGVGGGGCAACGPVERTTAAAAAGVRGPTQLLQYDSATKEYTLDITLDDLKGNETTAAMTFEYTTGLTLPPPECTAFGVVLQRNMKGRRAREPSSREMETQWERHWETQGVLSYTAGAAASQLPCRGGRWRAAWGVGAALRAGPWREQRRRIGCVACPVQRCEKLRIVRLGFGWEMAHEAVSRRPPISLSRVVARTEGYTYAAQVWDLSLVQGFLSPRAKP